MRGGKPLDAIDVYLKVLTAYRVDSLIAQFKLLYKDRPSFLGYVDMEDVEE
jgi:hypothetical protein